MKSFDCNLTAGFLFMISINKLRYTFMANNFELGIEFILCHGLNSKFGRSKSNINGIL